MMNLSCPHANELSLLFRKLLSILMVSILPFCFACAKEVTIPEQRKSNRQLLEDWMNSLDDSNGAKHYLQAALIYESDFDKDDYKEILEALDAEEGWKEEYEQYIAFIDDSGALDAIRAGLDKEYCDFEMTPRMSLEISHDALASLGYLLRLKAKKHESTGDLNSALECDLEALKFSQDIARGNDEFGKLQSLSQSWGLLDSISGILSEMEDESRIEAVLSSIALLEENVVPASELHKRVFARVRLEIEDALSSELGTLIILTRGSFIEKIGQLLRYCFFKKAVLKSFDNLSEKILESCNLPYAEFQKICGDDPPEGDGVIYVFWPAVNRYHEHTTRELASFRATRILLALKLYELRNGKYPEKLDALVSDIFDMVPFDPFLDEPFHYLQTDDEIIVYSVGHDLTDDEGAEYELENRTGDLVFSLPK